VLKGLAQVERDLGRLGSSRSLLEEATALCRAAGAPLALAHTVRHLGDVHRLEDHLDHAQACCEEMLSIFRREHQVDALTWANGLRCQSVLTQPRGKVPEARRWWLQARTHCIPAQVAPGVAECDEHLARLAAPA
jgi:hypothetical protein